MTMMSSRLWVTLRFVAMQKTDRSQQHVPDGASHICFVKWVGGGGGGGAMILLFMRGQEENVTRRERDHWIYYKRCVSAKDVSLLF